MKALCLVVILAVFAIQLFQDGAQTNNQTLTKQRHQQIENIIGE